MLCSSSALRPASTNVNPSVEPTTCFSSSSVLPIKPDSVILTKVVPSHHPPLEHRTPAVKRHKYRCSTRSILQEGAKLSKCRAYKRSARYSPSGVDTPWRSPTLALFDLLCILVSKKILKR